MPGIYVSRPDQAPEYFAKKRAAAYAASSLAQTWAAGAILATGDFNNDLHPDAVIASKDELVVQFGKIGAVDEKAANSTTRVSLNGLQVRGVVTADLDNDGWLDLVAYGENGLRVWRNRGRLGFLDVTKALGLDEIHSPEQVLAADFDRDGDLDLVVSSADGLHFWRNDGGNANRLLTVHLQGKRSNASALGVRVEAIAGSWRTSRTVRGEPLAIGGGSHDKLDSLKEHWFDLSTAQVDVPVTRELVTLTEPTLPSGSCPYLIAWDGKRFAFVTDILGAAPLGLPVAAGHFIDADPEEYLKLGDANHFPPRDGAFELRVTEELREVLYLDHAELVAVDHPTGTVVFPTSKLMPHPPFPRHELWTLRPIATPRRAVRNDGADETAALASIDGKMAGPVALRSAQLRGLAEPFSVTLDFGPLPTDRPLVLALTGWLRFGGGMANIGGSLDPKLPYPFPGCEVQRGDGRWEKVDVEVGAPAGKTKTILVDLAGKLPADARQLRLSTAFEIYWDRALLCENVGVAASSAVPLSRADLHWRGFSRHENWPESLPLTPRYDDVSPTPPWDRTPGGWVTRYGDVRELVDRADDKLALLDGGDELALAFDAKTLAPVADGMTRHYFLHVFGWDKDADFHVGAGWKVEPLPFRGMHDQEYGKEQRPPTLDDGWIQNFNTRWVGPTVVSGAKKAETIP